MSLYIEVVNTRATLSNFQSQFQKKQKKVKLENFLIFFHKKVCPTMTSN